VSVGARRGREGEPRNAGEDRGDGADLAPPDRLVEKPAAGREQEDQPEPERRLHECQRGEQERNGLERPAERTDECGGGPAWPAHQAGEQREPERVLEPYDARLKRLQRNLQAVERRGGRRAEDAEQERHG